MKNPIEAELERRLFIWRRAYKLAARYGGDFTKPGYTTALNWVRRAANLARREGWRFDDGAGLSAGGFARALTKMWELDNHPNDSW